LVTLFVYFVAASSHSLWDEQMPRALLIVVRWTEFLGKFLALAMLAGILSVSLHRMGSDPAYAKRQARFWLWIGLLAHLILLLSRPWWGAALSGDAAHYTTPDSPWIGEEIDGYWQVVWLPWRMLFVEGALLFFLVFLCARIGRFPWRAKGEGAVLALLLSTCLVLLLHQWVFQDCCNSFDLFFRGLWASDLMLDLIGLPFIYSPVAAAVYLSLGIATALSLRAARQAGDGES